MNTKKILVLLVVFTILLTCTAQQPEYDKQKDSTLVEFLYFMDVCRELSLATDSIDPYGFGISKISIEIRTLETSKDVFKIIVNGFSPS